MHPQLQRHFYRKKKNREYRELGGFQKEWGKERVSRARSKHAAGHAPPKHAAGYMHDLLVLQCRCRRCWYQLNPLTATTGARCSVPVWPGSWKCPKGCGNGAHEAGLEFKDITGTGVVTVTASEVALSGGREV